jgi:hypothetical protein
MRLRLFDRIRRLVHPRRSEATGTVLQGRHRRDQRPAPGSGPAAAAAEPVIQPPDTAPDEWPAPGASLVPGTQRGPARQAAGSPAVRVGGARARIREEPGEPDARPAPALPPDRYQTRPPADQPAAAGGQGSRAAAGGQDRKAALGDTRSEALARAAAGIPHQAGEAARPSRRGPWAARWQSLPFTAPHAQDRPRTADGRRHCGSLERIVWRQWDQAVPPPPELVEAVDRLAELPERIKERLAAGLDAIFIGPGGVPELDEMTALRGVRLPSGQASWDACAGAYGDRKIVVGSRPSPTPDVMCHEVGHALDDLDSPPGKWQSDSAQFRMLYDQCQPHLASDFHRQPGGLGRKEFFADAFAAIASGQRPALVDMLSGDTRTALRVMLYFNRRYGI